MIKTFRGLLLDGGQDKIRLSTKKGKIGYRIVKFQIINNAPGVANQESILKIYKIPQTAVDAVIDFSDGNLLGAAFLSIGSSVTYPSDIEIIFDQEVFNQDIYITHSEIAGALSCNYYIELEMETLTDNAAAVSTLRDIRLNPQKHA